MSRFQEVLGNDDESFGPGIDLVFSICAILLIVLSLVYHLYEASEYQVRYYRSQLEARSQSGETDLLTIAQLELQVAKLKKQKAKNESEIARLQAQLRKLLAERKVNDGEDLRILFADVIALAAGELTKLKRELETRDFPIAIEQRPDGLFFDMGVFFALDAFREGDIPKHQVKRIKKVGDAFRRILDQPILVGTRQQRLRDFMRIVVEGHTDDKKPYGDHFINYHFSKERAFSVMKLLMSENGLKPPQYKISIAGYAEFGRSPRKEPELDRDEDYLRAKMRRVTISIVPDYALLLGE